MAVSCRSEMGSGIFLVKARDKFVKRKSHPKVAFDITGGSGEIRTRNQSINNLNSLKLGV